MGQKLSHQGPTQTGGDTRGLPPVVPKFDLEKGVVIPPDRRPRINTIHLAKSAAARLRSKNRTSLAYTRTPAAQASRESRLRTKYGLSLMEYDRLLDSQENCCAICRNSLPDQRRGFVDHCHTTGKIRGILCTRCNSGLGQFKDNPDYLSNAIRYLSR